MALAPLFVLPACLCAALLGSMVPGILAAAYGFYLAALAVRLARRGGLLRGLFGAALSPLVQGSYALGVAGGLLGRKKPRETGVVRLERIPARGLAAKSLLPLLAFAWHVLAGSLGACGEPAAKEFSLHLPFPPGAGYRVLAGPGDPPSHLSPRNRYAYDFDLPPGSEVCAALPGLVIRTEARFDRPSGRPEENNLIAIRHRGGLVVEYHHLLQDGVLVRRGEEVEAGEVIGYSGASGMAEGAHLHLVLLNGESSVPIRFLECGRDPVKGELCTSQNVPGSLAARHGRLVEVDRASRLLLEAGNPDGARLLLESTLAEETSERALEPAERRKRWALRHLEEELRERLRRVLASANAQPGGVPGGRAKGGGR